jgi:hypothetical protein
MTVPGAVGVDVLVGMFDMVRGVCLDQPHRPGRRGLQGLHAESFRLTASAFCTHGSNSRFVLTEGSRRGVRRQPQSRVVWRIRALPNASRARWA